MSREIDYHDCKLVIQNVKFRNIIYRSQIMQYYKKVKDIDISDIVTTQKYNLQNDVKAVNEQEMERQVEKESREIDLQIKQDLVKYGKEENVLFEEDSKWKDDQFEYFSMKCSSREIFEKHS